MSGVTPPTGVVTPGRLARLRNWVSCHRAPIVMVALAIIIPEVLTGSTPVLNLIDPFAVAGLLGFYGAGVLLIRDLAIRWGKGWAAILPLGLAYGIAEEGIATKTMVYPRSTAAGHLATYGHYLGISWNFAVVIDIFHAVYSIALPILIIGLLYPETRGQRWLSDRGLTGTFLILAATVTFGFFGFVPGYFEGWAVLGFLLIILGAFVGLARYCPPEWAKPCAEVPQRSPAWFLGLGIAFAAGWFFFYLPAPFLLSIPLLSILGEIGTAAGAFCLARKHLGRSGNSLHCVYFAAGILSWYIPWDVVIGLFLGDYLVVFFLVAIYILLYRLKVRYSRVVPTTTPGSEPTPPFPGVDPGKLR